MAITRTDVENVALLARFRLSDAESDTPTAELAHIITYVDHRTDLDTDGVEPMAHALEVSNVFSTDVVQPSLSRDQALANAPSCNERGYLVPAVLGG